MRTSTANLVAALQFIVTEYGLDKKGPAEAEPEYLGGGSKEPIMQRQTNETTGTDCPKASRA